MAFSAQRCICESFILCVTAVCPVSLLCSILLCEPITFNSSILLLMTVWVVSGLEQLCVVLLWTQLWWTQAHISVGEHLGKEILVHRVCVCSALVVTAGQFSKVVVATHMSGFFSPLYILILMARFPPSCFECSWIMWYCHIWNNFYICYDFSYTLNMK